MIDASSPLTVVNRTILKQLSRISFTNHSHLYIALNKVDLVNPKSRLLQYSNDISELIWKTKIQLLKETETPTLDQQQWENDDLFMISALQKDGTDDLLETLRKQAKPGDWRFEESTKSDMGEEKRSDEIVREKVFKYLNGAVPFGLKTRVKEWKEKDGVTILRDEISVAFESSFSCVGWRERNNKAAAAD